MSMLLTMEIFRTVTLLFIFCFYTIFCHPSRPLNERSTELAWQAWLLVDDQNQNKHHDLDSFTRRRITPKSVFIAPTFSPESLPACAEGYRADSMGRCIRIIKLDEEAHLDFLLQKLNAQFGNYDDMDEDSQEELPTPGPFQLNIPLNGPVSNGDNTDDNLDIAIVVAPTNGNFVFDDHFKNSVKRKSSQNGDSNIHENRPLNEQPELEDTIKPLIIENRFPIIEHAETTTESTTEPSTETTEPTTLTMPTTTITTLATETTTLEVEADTTSSNQHALFFLEDSLINTTHVENATSSEGTTEVTTTTNDEVALTTELNGGHQIVEITSTTRQSEGGMRFPTEEASHHIDYIKNPEQITEPNILPYVNRYVSQFNYGTETSTMPSTEQFQALFSEYINSRGADLKGTERFVFKNYEDRPQTDRFHSGDNGVFNHRNRDKTSNLWSLPPSWSESSPHKPIVLRFSRRSNSRHLLEEQIHHSQEYYREVPTKDFSYIFGVNPIAQRRNSR